MIELTTDYAAYRAHLRERMANARINGVDTTALIENLGYAKFSAIPDSVLPDLEKALDSARQTYQQWAAEKVYKLLLKSTEQQARTINAFVGGLLTPTPTQK